MLSTYSHRASLLSDTMFGNPLIPVFDAGSTPWECPEYFPPNPFPNPVISNSGSDALIHSPEWEPDALPSPNTVISSSGSDDPDQNRNSKHANSNSCSEEPKRKGEASPVDERKRRRMISNRESARRSRMRKQKHLENLRREENRFRIENRDLSNRLRFFLYHCHRVQTENNQLRSEYDMLRHKLMSDIRQILVLRQLQQFTTAWPCNTDAS
ncbi:Ocs element-binding factor 1 [Morella rubra]|uniref:Ocs element-binding factor 1 n=1 Tax=Morella rubra TaxID=262757 RepID=A0A6A1VSC1_9ROSI|nr:Ocs element-binding factor 1 [Morella rubra]